MHFTRLRLNGFKSFVDPTEMLIADGLTGVVGPNGCGKSNLLEALRWVMGETRASAMRGGGMEDVIFAGASTRAARNFAEVSLHIDNTERRAPAAFNDHDLLDITRRITRDAGSAYKVGGKDVRARDVQLLFADASTGAQSPSLVRQGQISELINAKPKARRRILEEAAGISGLYQRRHEAELKLKSSETNLSRLDDVLDQLRTQLAQLSRQAKQAARYRAIGADLRESETLLLVLNWQVAAAARDQAEETFAAEIRALGQAEAVVSRLRKETESAEAALPPLREEATIAAAILQRIVVEREGLKAKAESAVAHIADLRARLGQIDADTEREAVLDGDARESLSRLEEEAASIARNQAGEAAAQDEAAELSEVAEATLAHQEESLSELAQDLARETARHDTATRAAEAAEKARAKAQQALSETAQALIEEHQKSADAERAKLDAADALEAADAGLKRTEAQMASVESIREQADARHASLKSDRATAESTLRALSGEVDTLARLVEKKRDSGDQVLDQITVAPGYETALGAALDEDLAAPLSDELGRSGWRALPPYQANATLPAGITSLSEHVTAPTALARRLAMIGVVSSESGSELQVQLSPGQRLVSLEGDVWRWDGLARAAKDRPSAAALRLQQINRLTELRREQSQARQSFEAVQVEETKAARALKDVSDEEAAARLARRAADAAFAEAGRRHSRAGIERDQAEDRVTRLQAAHEAYSAEETEALEKSATAKAELTGLSDLQILKDRLEAQRLSVEAARLAVMTRRTQLEEHKRAVEGRHRRMERIDKEATQWRQRLSTASDRASDLAARRTRCAEDLTKAEPLPAEIAAQTEALVADITRAETRKATAEDQVTGAEAALRDARAAEREAEAQATAHRETRAAAEARRDASEEVLQTVAHRLSEELNLDPAEALAGQDPERLANSTPEDVEARVHRLRRQRDALGAVNLRAEEDAREVEAEVTTLENEKSDLEAAIAKLRSGISSLNREGRERLLTAFEQVNDNFASLFTDLFGGGEARLALVESDDPLEAGLEILCQPPGKKLSTLSLLSGGEQTLTAMALIFGVFLANPAPICVLDEVDAPLDDANVNRFCDLLDDMTRRTRTRFLIITHHAVTMSRMDRLFGVTMAEQGISQLVSVDLRAAESLVA
ncbi:MAG: chromosome segregation protein SMC [Pseudomonadota bacterium]